MACVDARVDHVRAGTFTSAVVIHVAGCAAGLVGDAAEAPWSTGLRDVCVDGEDGLLLNILDLLQW